MKKGKRKYKKIKKQRFYTRQDEQTLSPTDKIVWVYKIDELQNIVEVTTVSYITMIGKKHYTVIYYDNSHDGIMHSHLRNSVLDSSDSPFSLKVKKKGNQGDLMHWAIKNIRDNWYYYRRKFYKRSDLKSEF